MAKTTVGLCFLVWNERQGCEIDVPLTDLSQFDEVFAIDGGSHDGTVEYLAAAGIPVHAQIEKGLNGAYWQAIETCRCDTLIVFFPKGTLDPTIVLPEFQRRLLQGYHLVLASRIAKGGRNEEDAHLFRPRKWGVQCIGLLASLVWRREGPRITDILHGVKGFSCKAFRQMAPSRTGVSIDLELAVRAYRLRLHRIEFPVTETARSYGATRFRIVPTGILLARFFLSELRRPATLPAPATDELIDSPSE